MTDTELAPEGGKISVHEYTDEMRGSYLNYAMSVIKSRALPDVRDGLKPVHRRIVFGMEVGDYVASKKHKKSARIVGDVLGKYHPHGDSSVYMAMVRLAQDWSVRYPLIDGQGNFGSIDGDSPAAMRYTEARMSRLAMEMVADLGKGTVPFKPNYDGSEMEPAVLPARFPNLLVNGQIGVAVGMATNIPTHNLGEAIDASLAYMDNPALSIDELLQIMPGPDFPTAGLILGHRGIRQAYETGNGTIVMSGVARIEDGKRGKQQIIISEIPYLVNKENLVTRIVEMVNDKRLEGISDCRDESGREDAIRIVIDVKADADPSIVLNSLRSKTDFQSNFSVNLTCLDSKGQPKVMGVIEVLQEFIAFRRQTVRLRTQFDLDKARATQIRQIGLYAAVAEVDRVVQTIRSSPDTDTARVRLMEIEFTVDDALAQMIRESDPDENPGATFKLSDVQADAILALPLRRLTGLERDKIAEDVRALQLDIRVFLDILANPSVLDNVVRQEMLDIKAKHNDARRTRIEANEADDIDDEALVERRDIIVTLTNTGYAKRTEVSAYRAQKRGGKGKIGMETKDDDFVVQSIVCNTRSPLLAFTERGKVFAIKAYKLPDAGPNAKGRPLVNYIQIEDGDKVSSLVVLPEDREELEARNLVFVTDIGTIRRNKASDFLDIRKTGKIAMGLVGEDGIPTGRLVSVLVTDEEQDVLISTSGGNCIRYQTSEVRVFTGRDSIGVRAISLKPGQRVVSATIIPHSDAEAIERDVFASEGVGFIKAEDMLGADGQPRVMPASLTFEPSPTEEKPDRVRVTMATDMLLKMKAQEVFLLSVSQNGYGKRSSSHEYRVVASRGGMGITAADINDRTGDLVACLPVAEEDGLILVTDGGMAIRTRVSDISVMGRSSRGVRLLSVPDGQRIVGVATVPASVGGDDEADEINEQTSVEQNGTE